MTLGSPRQRRRAECACGHDSDRSLQFAGKCYKRCFEANAGEVAAVIVEPVAANMGVVPPMPRFLERTRRAGAPSRRACSSATRSSPGFASATGRLPKQMGVAPDLIMLGKIIGGGMPIGAVAGRAELMDLLAPAGPVYQAGTLSGNPISVRAGLETLSFSGEPGIYEQLEKSGETLAKGLDRRAAHPRVEKGCVNRVGSLVTMFLGRETVADADEARRCDTAKFATYFHRMLERGIYLPPSQFEAMFLSLAHSVADIDRDDCRRARIIAGSGARLSDRWHADDGQNRAPAARGCTWPARCNLPLRRLRAAWSDISPISYFRPTGRRCSR